MKKIKIVILVVLSLYIYPFALAENLSFNHLQIKTDKPAKKKKKPATDLGEKFDPPLQATEDLSNFIEGSGAKPANAHSAVLKGHVKLKKPQLGGSGCADGTVAASITTDNKTVSLLFDNYIAQAGNVYGVLRDIKSCTVQLPIEVPSGYQFTIVKLDYRGFNAIPEGGRTRYVTTYTFVDDNSAKQIGKKIRRNYVFSGPLESEYIISSDVASKPVWSLCGKNVSFRLETRAIAVTNDQGEDVMAAIDSIDASVGSSVEYHLLWRECK